MNRSAPRIAGTVAVIALLCAAPHISFAKDRSQSKTYLQTNISRLTDTISIKSDVIQADVDIPTPISIDALSSTATPATSSDQTTSTDEEKSTSSEPVATSTSENQDSNNVLSPATTTPVINSTNPSSHSQNTPTSNTTNELKKPETPIASTYPINTRTESAMQRFFTGTFANYYESDAFSVQTTGILLALATAAGLFGITLVSGLIEWVTAFILNNRRNVLNTKMTKTPVE